MFGSSRRDALRQGQADADTATLADFLGRFSHNLRLEVLESDRLRVPASLASPAAVMVNGCMLTASANVDLAAQNGRQVKSGDASRLYVGTCRTSGSGVTEDIQEKRWLWNACNQVPRYLFKGEDAIAYAYNGST